MPAPLLARADQPPSILLGSFSNYLVTKSSVPVVVARKPTQPSKPLPSNVKGAQREPRILPGNGAGSRLVHAKVE